MSSTRIRFAAAALTACALLLGACSQNRGPTGVQVVAEKSRPLPEVAAGDKNFSSYQPANAYQELGPTLLARTMFQAAGPPGYRVEVRDLRVDAGKKAENISLPGAAFLELLQGSAALTLEGKRQELPPGSTFAVSQGQAFALEATSAQPLIVRVRLLSAQ